MSIMDSMGMHGILGRPNKQKKYANKWTPEFLVLDTGNLVATKRVHIKHYGLKIGGPNFW